MFLKNSLTVSTLVTFIIVGIMMAYLVNLSTITSILLNPFKVGNSGIKFMLTTSKGCDGTGMD